MNESKFTKYKSYLIDYVETITQRSKGKGYVCPLCGSGTGANGTGAFFVRQNMWKCFSCGEGGDIFDLYKRVNNCDTETAYKGIEALYNGQTPSPVKEVPTHKETAEEMKIRTNNAHMKLINGLDDGKGKNYFIGRGFSYEAIKKFNLGYMVNDYGNEVVTIPQDNGSYIERYINGKNRYQKGETGLFICDGNKSDILFICEAWADALSLWELGYNAISVNSTNNYRKAIPYAKNETKYKAFVIAFDNDESGEKASCHLLDDLRKESLNCIKFDYKRMKQSFNDINDFFIGDREELRRLCEEMALEAHRSAVERQNNDIYRNILENEKSAHTAKMDAKTLDIKNKLEQSNMVNYITNAYPKDLESNKKCYKSGFLNWDNETGGLYTGLYVLGAVSSLGKTTFLLNVADNLARQGEHVLFFSLEMSRIELFTKSLARIISTYHLDSERANSISATDLRKRNFDEDSQEAKDERKARSEYLENIAPRMTIIECDFETTIQDIMNMVTTYIDTQGVKPVVFVDYIQIMAPRDPRMTERQNADDIVKGLKILQSKNDLLIFAVSSFNRNNYFNQVDYESFKESGGIEYTADCMIGLQLEAVNRDFKDDAMKRAEMKKAKKANPRFIEFVCVKNRGGVANYNLNFVYYPNCDLFIAGTPSNH